MTNGGKDEVLEPFVFARCISILAARDTSGILYSVTTDAQWRKPIVA